MTDSESSLLGSSNETILALYSFPADINLLMQKNNPRGCRFLAPENFCRMVFANLHSNISGQDKLV
jgi:hypothetical protein